MTLAKSLSFVFALACLVTTTVAIGAPVFAGPVVRYIPTATPVLGHVTAPKAEPALTPTPASVCFWEVPKKLIYVNLYAVQHISVVERGGGFVTVIFLVRDSIQIPLDLGEDVLVHVRLIQKRLEACKQGESK